MMPYVPETENSLRFSRATGGSATSACPSSLASRAVSRKVGYQPNGRQRVARRGEAAEQERLLLTPDTFHRGEPIHVAGAAEVRKFLGLA